MGPRRFTLSTTVLVACGLSLAACDDSTTAADGAADAPSIDAQGADTATTDATSNDAAEVSSPMDAAADAAKDAATRDVADATADLADVASDASAPFDWSADWSALTAGVRTINPGDALASPVVSLGVTAFPVVYDANHTAFVAAARAGEGRVVVFGHESLVDAPGSTTDDRGALVLNAVRWALRGRAGAVVGIDGARDGLHDFLTSSAVTVRDAAVSDLASVQVWITGADVARTPSEVARIQAWVRAGGGLIVAGQAWAWGETHSNPVEGFPGDQVLHDLGLAITTDTDTQSGVAISVRAPTDLDHAVRALDRVRDHASGARALSTADQVIASATARRALRVEPYGSAYVDRVRATRARLTTVIPSAEHPVRPAAQPLDALTVLIDARLAATMPVAEVTAHPAAADFPGSVPAGVAATTVTATVDLSYAGRTARLWGDAQAHVWRSLGAYAAPGQRVTVTVPAAAVGAGLDVLVGSWTDDNSATEEWTRVPIITRAFPITSTDTEVASAFGGIVYVRVPPGASVGAQTVTVRGAVASPRFVLGQTTDDAWRTTQRSLPGLYAELETAKLIVTVPSSLVRTLDAPTALMTWWDRVLDAEADLATISHDRARAERLVFDRQIVAGYMHADYPIMAFTPQASEALDLATLSTRGNWGFFHELGHNHQFADWSWAGTTECTVNLYSAYVMERVVGLAPRTGHAELEAAARTERDAAYVTGGRNFTRDWSAWTCLDTFLQLQEGFGWTLFQTLDTDYLGLSAAERPTAESDRIQQWVIRSSRRANRNLIPFYTAWGFPIADATRSAVSSLPEWTSNPMH